MEWQKIKASPEKRSGVLQKKQGLFKRPEIIPGYKAEDVKAFYLQQRDAAVLQNLCCPEVFDQKNSEFLDAVEHTDWPVETLDGLPVMYVPICATKSPECEEQPEDNAAREEEELREFETLKPFLDLAMFETFTLEQQLLVLAHVDAKTKKQLLSEVTEERRKELYDAATSTAENKA